MTDSTSAPSSASGGVNTPTTPPVVSVAIGGIPETVEPVDTFEERKTSSTSRKRKISVSTTTPPAEEPLKHATEVISPNADTDFVSLGAIVYKNIHAKKSLTVHHLQRRLLDLGYAEAGADPGDGFYGDNTSAAVRRFAAEHELEPSDTELPTDEIFEAIFYGDPNVTIQ